MSVCVCVGPSIQKCIDVHDDVVLITYIHTYIHTYIYIYSFENLYIYTCIVEIAYIHTYITPIYIYAHVCMCISRHKTEAGNSIRAKVRDFWNSGVAGLAG